MGSKNQPSAIWLWHAVHFLKRFPSILVRRKIKHSLPTTSHIFKHHQRLCCPKPVKWSDWPDFWKQTAFQGQEVVKRDVKSLHQKTSFVLYLYRTHCMGVLNQTRQNNEISSPTYLWENFVWQKKNRAFNIRTKSHE